MADANLLDMLRRSGGIEAVSKQLEIAPGVAAQGVEALLPALVGGFARRGEVAGGGEAGLGDLVGMLGGLGGGGLAANVLGPDVLLAHGAGGNTLVWWQQIPEFSARYTTIAFDHRAFGRSPDARACLSLGRRQFFTPWISPGFVNAEAGDFHLRDAASGKPLAIEHDLSAPSIKTSLSLDCSLARRELGWAPTVALRDGLQRTLTWLRAQPERL